MVKHKKINFLSIVLWIAIIGVAAVDIFATSFGLIPALGDLLSISSNLVTEIIELALVVGLVASKK